MAKDEATAVWELNNLLRGRSGGEINRIYEGCHVSNGSVATHQYQKDSNRT